MRPSSYLLKSKLTHLAAGILVAASFLALTGQCSAAKPAWTSPNNYRILLAVDGRSISRSNSPASIDIDFVHELSRLGAKGTFDEHTIEVMAYDTSGKPFIFDSTRTGYEKHLVPFRIENYFGITRVTMSFVIPEPICRRFAVYFDTAESGLGKPKRYRGLVGDGDWFSEGYERREIGACAFDDFCDFDGDGDLDLFKGGTEPFIYCYENVGNNRFIDRGKLTSGGAVLTLPVYSNHRGWVVVTFDDWDNDGDQDLLAYLRDGPYTDQIVFYENTTQPGGLLTFTDRGPLYYGPPNYDKHLGGEYFVGITIVDWDGDGKKDILAPRKVLEFHRNLGKDRFGNYRFADPVSIQADGEDIKFIIPRFDCADIDNDGDLDLFAGTKTNPAYLFENIGTRTEPKLAKGQTIALKYKIMIRDAYTFAKVADFTGDGLLDFVIGRYWERVPVVRPHEMINHGRLYENVGTATEPKFEERDAYHGAPYTERFQRCDVIRQNCVRAVDWNNDGKTDLLAGDTDGHMWYFRNQTNHRFPVFAAGEKMTAGGELLSLIRTGGHARHDICDWNNDGKKDLIIADGFGGLTLFLNEGTDAEPVLGYGRTINAGMEQSPIRVGSRSSVLVCDWNHDGKKDVVMASPDGYEVFKNVRSDEDPAFVYSELLPLTNYIRPNMGSFVDWDGDGRMDFIGCNFENNIRLYKNISWNPEPQFEDPDGQIIVKPWTVMMCSGADVVDWNMDGDLDILTGQGHAGSGLRFFERDFIEDNLNDTHPKVMRIRAEKKPTEVRSGKLKTEP